MDFTVDQRISQFNKKIKHFESSKCSPSTIKTITVVTVLGHTNYPQKLGLWLTAPNIFHWF